MTALDLAGVPHGFAHLVALHEGCAGALDRVLTAARGCRCSAEPNAGPSTITGA